VLPRRTLFARRAAGRREEQQAIAANIDLVFLVCGLDGDFNLRRLERYLALAAESGARPVVVLNKADLCADIAGRLAETAAVAGTAPVVAVHTQSPEGIAPLRDYLFDGCTAALFAKAGFSKREVLKAHGIVGFPLVEVSCRFMAPSYFSEDVVVESEIIKWGTSSFHVQHRLYKGKLLAVECLETRVWAARSATDAEKIQSKPLPREVIAKFGKSISKTQRRKRG